MAGCELFFYLIFSFRFKWAPKCSLQLWMGGLDDVWIGDGPLAPEAKSVQAASSGCQSKPQKSLSEGIGAGAKPSFPSVPISGFRQSKIQVFCLIQVLWMIKARQRTCVQLRLKHEKLVKPTLNEYFSGLVRFERSLCCDIRSTSYKM